jgi:hypothetical protein
MSQYDTHSLHDFLLNTPEGGLRKIIVDRAKTTDVHCNLLVKVARACNAEQFSEHFNKQDFPKLRMSAGEEKIKEKFWTDCTSVLIERGLLQPMPAQKIAA